MQQSVCVCVVRMRRASAVLTVPRVSSPLSAVDLCSAGFRNIRFRWHLSSTKRLPTLSFGGAANRAGDGSPRTLNSSQLESISLVHIVSNVIASHLLVRLPFHGRDRSRLGGVSNIAVVNSSVAVQNSFTWWHAIACLFCRPTYHPC